MQKIQALSEERARLVAGEGKHHANSRDHDLQVLWNPRRLKLARERADLDTDFFYRYALNPGSNA